MNRTSPSLNRYTQSLDGSTQFNVSVDCVIFGYDQNQLKVLLVESDMPQFKGKLSLVGDLLSVGETLRVAAQRILYNTTHLEDVYLEQVEAFSALERHPYGRVITLAYYSLLMISKTHIEDAKNKNLRWVPIAEISEMAFDHKEILDTCYTMLRKKLRECPIGFNLLPKKFSLNQLQTLYETVLDIKLDKRNFRRKLNNLDLLIDLNESQDDVSHRPAKLYRFDQERYDRSLESGTLNFEL